MRKKLMKKINITALTALALTFAGCASVQEIDLPVQAGSNFEVYAPTADTKTVNAGLSTLWESGDKFSLFHAKSGATSYVSDGAFIIDNTENGHATGSVATLGTGKYDWYMVYPYTSSTTSPKSVPVTIGASAQSSQVQDGADDMGHLAGEGFPLAGKVSGVSPTAVPTIPVAPIVSVIAVNVTNPGEGTVTVNSISFQAPESIVGSFKADVTGKTPVFTAVSASDEAKLDVTGGAVLKKDQNAVFYLGIKPFEAAAGTKLTLTVNDEIHSLTLTRDVSFTAGKIKTLNVTLLPSGPDPLGTYYFKRVSSYTAGKKYILVAAETDEDENVTLRMAQAMPEGTNFGRLYAEDVEEVDGVITLSSQENAFTFYDGETGTLIRQADGRYLYNNNSNDNVYAGTTPSNGYYWTISYDEQGQAAIVNRLRQLKYNTTSTVRAFQTRKTGDSGLLIRLYELQNSDDAVADFIQNTTPGVYAYEGSDWLYEDGTMQLSVRAGNGDLAFRIYEPSTFTVTQVTGLPETISENDRVDVRIARYVKQAATHFTDLSAQVVHIADGKAWLMAGNGTGIIVCIQ